MISKIQKNMVYLDYTATSPVEKSVMDAMYPYFYEKYGNSASLHIFGRQAKVALENSREVVATALGAKAREVIFTSSATEANNLAIKGICFANQAYGKHIIVSEIEHESVLESARFLERNGFVVTYVPVTKDGQVNIQALKKCLRDDTILVSIMHANNEIGTIQPIREIAKIIQEKIRYFKIRNMSYKLPVLHTDAVQTFGKLSLNVHSLGVDLLTASSHKIYGPKGAGMLYIGKDVLIEPILHGGGHERGMRSSTVNVPTIVGFAQAVSLAIDAQKDEYKRVMDLGSLLLTAVKKSITDSRLNGSVKNKLPHIINLSFKKVPGEELLYALDARGFAVSIASGCSGISMEPSHVLLAMGFSEERALQSIRVSLGRSTSKKDILKFVAELKACVSKIRNNYLSPKAN